MTAPHAIVPFPASVQEIHYEATLRFDQPGPAEVRFKTRTYSPTDPRGNTRILLYEVLVQQTPRVAQCFTLGYAVPALLRSYFKERRRRDSHL